MFQFRYPLPENTSKKREHWQSVQKRKGCSVTRVPLGMVPEQGCPALGAWRGRRGHGQEAKLTFFSKSCFRMYLDVPAHTFQISTKQRKGSAMH